MDKACVFKFRYGNECDDRLSCSENVGPARIRTIINASKTYGDELHVDLEKQLLHNENLKIKYHKNCVSRYTSKSNLSKYESNDCASQPRKRLRRSDIVSFDFFHHCLYCGERCDLNKDPKNPERWRPAYLCRSTYSERSEKPYKQYLLDKCDERGDGWANDVRLRIEGAISDLHAAEARYHKDCLSMFLANRNRSSYGQEPSSTCDANDQALQFVVKILSEDKRRIWNSIELHKEYTNHMGSKLSRSRLIEELCGHFSGELLVLSSPGYANIVSFCQNAATTLKCVKDDEDGNDVDSSIAKVAKQIVKDCKDITFDKTRYRLHIDKDIAVDYTPDTLGKLLAAISPKLDKSLPALMIGNIVTSVIRNQSTDLQLALGVLLRDSKTVVNHMNDYRVTCTYDEVLRFKKSAAVASAADPCQQGISNAQDGLVQVICDNFDADISSPNGKLSTHSLAMIVTQPMVRHTGDIQMEETIMRLQKDEVSQIINDITTSTFEYSVSKKPAMSEEQIPMPKISKEFQTLQNVSKRRAEENDFAFFQDILTVSKCPEYNGYNTKLCREQGHTLMPKTKVVYMPLIDKPPADPSTMIAAMIKAEEISHRAGQGFVVFTADQQLYRIALNVIWENPDRFSNFHLRLGGMHLLMSYCSSIGTLMADSGIVEVLSVSFGGVLKMLSGKKYPQNIRAFRMLVEELLRYLFEKCEMASMTDLKDTLHKLTTRSKTSKLWVNCFIRPVFTILKYIRSEREADWALHLDTVEEMLPLFFAAGHINYARYASYYLQSMKGLPEAVAGKFIKGEHTMHHKSGIFNGIWSDMAIETTYMRYGHGRSGIIGITLKPETLKTWAYSLHACNLIINDLDLMREKDPVPAQTTHKEEMEARMKSDADDRKSLRDKLELCISPLDPDQHPNGGLVNIVTGQVTSHPSVNVENAVELGTAQMESFVKSWPNGFNDTIPKVVNTMALTRKHLKVGDVKVFDTETIYARAMGLQSSPRSLDTDTLLAHELAPHPTSMFDTDGHMREAKTKSNLKNSLKVETSSRLTEKDIDVTFLDGCAVLWVISWPSSGTVQDYLDRFRGYLSRYLKDGDVYLVFDRYNDGSIKESTRLGRDQGASRMYMLGNMSRLPAQKIILTVTKNKAQLIDLICQDLVLHKEDVINHKLVVTGKDPVPFEINQGIVSQRRDMSTTQEEGDTIIIQQVSAVSANNSLVVADDTDIFVLLLHFCFNGSIRSRVMMVSPIQGRAVIDINATMEKHRLIIPDLLAAHGLTGCDTVATCFGIRKGVALKVLKQNEHILSCLGNVSVPLADVIKQTTRFMLTCYGQPKCESMTEARQKIWSSKIGKTLASAPKLASLPPTDEAFKENVARAHFQVAIWKNSLEPDPPALDPVNFGWSRNNASKSLAPITVPTNVPLAPQDLLKLIRCSCSGDTPCNTHRCSCKSSTLACTVFCSCQGGQACSNDHTRQVQHTEHMDEYEH